MNKTFANNKPKLILATTLLLSGCASIQHNLPTNYRLRKNTNTSVLAFSLQCNIHNGKGWIDFSRDYTSNKKLNKKSKDYRVFFHCNGDKLGKPQIKAISLPAGYYSLYDFTVACSIFDDCIMINSINFKPIKFVLHPDKLTYLGRLQFIQGKGNKFKTRLSGASEYDYPILKRMLPNLNQEDFYTLNFRQN